MLFIGKSISDIQEEDINSLFELGYSEIKTREYKQILPGNSDSEKKEFLADISSFANASGGFIIYGIKEENGIAKSVQGLRITDQDSEKLRLESIIQCGIQPRIPGITIHTILLADKSYVFVISIPQSWCSPHMVTFQNNSKFYSRNSSGKYQFDVSEIKQAMLKSEGVADKIRNFRIDRIAKVIADESPIQLNQGAKIALHIIPVQAFLQGNEISINSLVHDFLKIQTLASSPNNYRINMDGVVTYFNTYDGMDKSYTQVFRNGIVESIDGSILSRQNDELTIPINILETSVIESCCSLLQLLNSYSIEPPYILCLSLLNVKGYRFSLSQEMKNRLFFRGESNKLQIDRNMIIIPEILLDTILDDEIKKSFKPVFDSIWNACGFNNSWNYDEKGKWKPI